VFALGTNIFCVYAGQNISRVLRLAKIFFEIAL
jgi:hypothetical protein